MAVSQPILIALPDYGALFAESVHAPDFRMAERRDAYHKVLYILKGHVAYREAKNREPILIEEGCVLFVPSHTRHRLTDEKPSVLLLLCLAESFVNVDSDLRQLWDDLAKSSNHHIRLNRPSRDRLEQMWRRGVAEQHERRTGAGLLVRALAAQTLVHLARHQPHAGASTAERVHAVANEIRESFYDQWTLDRAAARAGLSRRRFSELFYGVTRQTLGEFLTQQRLSHAAQLLRAGDHSVLGAMFSSGFNDVSHFYRLFRKRFGWAPARWAATQRDRSAPRGGASGASAFNCPASARCDHRPPRSSSRR